MKRVMLRVAYDGTNYCGWQIQPNAVTIEGVLNHTLSQLLNEEIVVIGASRTDSGVHALDNVAVFDTDSRIPPEKISYALNQRLPDDIVVQSSVEVERDFHPRHCETTKTYEYHIYQGTFPLPTKSRYCHFVHYELDVDAMQKAGSQFVGTHDFTSFCSIHSQAKDAVRTIYSLMVIKQENEIIIRVQGSGFLYNMVRIIAGTLIQVGMHFMSVDCITDVIQKKDRQLAGPTAPAKGLTLVKIDYTNGR